MSEKFFTGENALFMYDPESYTVFTFSGRRWEKTLDADLIRTVRFKSKEISKTAAMTIATAIRSGAAAGLVQSGRHKPPARRWPT
jgi:hypothetical protein